MAKNKEIWTENELVAGPGVKKNANYLILEKKNLTITVGLDYDNSGIRAAMITTNRRGRVNIEALEELCGPMNDTEKLVESISAVKERLPTALNVNYVTCLKGKEAYAVQLPFPELPPAEMETALKLELRKYLPFDAGKSVIDYQVLDEQAVETNRIPVLVTAVSQRLLEEHLEILTKCGITPAIVDILPLSIANAFWTAQPPPPGSDQPRVIVYLGPDLCTVVIDSNNHPLFYRNIYFNSKEMLIRKEGTDIPDINSLLEEISLSLSYYIKENPSEFSELYLTGNFSNIDVTDALKKKTKLTVTPLQLCEKCGYDTLDKSGKFDIPLTLALRG